MMSRVGLWVVVLITGGSSWLATTVSAAPAASGRDDADTSVNNGNDTDARGTSAAAERAGRPPGATSDPTSDPTSGATSDPHADQSSKASSDGPPAIVTEGAGAKAIPSGAASYGVGARGRWVSVPGWLLGLFTKHNIPLLTFGHFALEGFRRVGNFDIALAFSYQNMSPRDGNWLGTAQDPVTETRFLQFRGLSLYSADISFLWHTMVSSWFGMHAGAGLGVAVVRGDLFIFSSEGCTSNNLDNLEQCHPRDFTCANGVCTSPASLARVSSKDVLPVVPIVNMVLGVDFRLPDVKGWEAKLEAGFYDAFFFGFGVAYTF